MLSDQVEWMLVGLQVGGATEGYGTTQESLFQKNVLAAQWSCHSLRKKILLACLKYTVIHCPILESIQEAPVIMVQRQKTFDVVILNFHICISSFFRGENMPHLMDFSMKFYQWRFNEFTICTYWYLADFI